MPPEILFHPRVPLYYASLPQTQNNMVGRISNVIPPISITPSISTASYQKLQSDVQQLQAQVRTLSNRTVRFSPKKFAIIGALAAIFTQPEFDKMKIHRFLMDSPPIVKGISIALYIAMIIGTYAGIGAIIASYLNQPEKK